ncbi:MAG: alpha/beta hydrolase [Phycisphaerae bacterium]
MILAGWPIFDALSRNWAMVAMITTIIVLVVIPYLILMKYVRISLNIVRTVKPPLGRNPLDFAPLEGESIRFPAYDGLPLNGSLIPGNPLKKRRGLLVFAHEFCADMTSCARYCRALHEAGYDILTFDFRAHGQSDADADYTPRQWVSDRELFDLRGAIAFAETHLRDHDLPVEIGLIGISRGACAAILGAAEAESVKAIVADGAFSTDTTIEFFMKRWAYIFARLRFVYENHPPIFWRFLRWTMMHFAKKEFKCAFPSVRKTLRKMNPRPILFIHGEKDSYLPVEQSRRLYALAAQPKYLWVVPGARHNQAAVVQAANYGRITTDFFDTHLADLPAKSALASRQALPTEVSLPADASDIGGSTESIPAHAVDS